MAYMKKKNYILLIIIIATLCVAAFYGQNPKSERNLNVIDYLITDKKVSNSILEQSVAVNQAPTTVYSKEVESIKNINVVVEDLNTDEVPDTVQKVFTEIMKDGGTYFKGDFKSPRSYSEGDTFSITINGFNYDGIVTKSEVWSTGSGGHVSVSFGEGEKYLTLHYGGKYPDLVKGHLKAIGLGDSYEIRMRKGYGIYLEHKHYNKNFSERITVN